MSDYNRIKAVRYKPTDEQTQELMEKYSDCWSLDLPKPFTTAPTEEFYIDYVLDESYGEECGEWGKVRNLTETETNKYVEIFSAIIDNPIPENFRLVDFCWYNCCEAPDYFDDPFYDEI